MYGGQIEGIGPRYCPSIEDKIMRFADKPRHQVFVEPMGLDTDEIYLQGLSTSLPEDVQLAFYRTIKGFENVQIMRNAYAIEYDCVDPLALKPSLEFKTVPGLDVYKRQDRTLFLVVVVGAVGMWTTAQTCFIKGKKRRSLSSGCGGEFVERWKQPSLFHWVVENSV